MQPMLNIALRAARLASDQIQRAQDKVAIIRSEKSELAEFIQETTLTTEQSIAHTIQKAYPKHAIQGQFSGDHNPNSGSAEATWYVSAIDNLDNFSNGLPQIAVCLAAVIKGKIEHALILNPVTGEEFTASRGYGAVLNGRRIRVTDNRGLENATIATNFSDTSGNIDKLNNYVNMATKLHQNRGVLLNTGSAALNFANTAAGKNDGSFADNLQQATVLSGALLTQEAGGLVGDLAGGPNFKKSAQLVAGNAKVFKALVKAQLVTDV
jgi:myo-inositol-1(or 4)-monophosphatase